MACWVCTLLLDTLVHLSDTTIHRWSYGINLTLIGNAVYASMDIPDAFLAAVKLLNYLDWDRSQNTMFVIFIGVWT